MDEKSEYIFKTLRNQAAKSYMDSDTKNPAAERRLFIAVLGILVFVGSAAIKAIFRKHFVVTKQGLVSFIFCFLSFGGISALSFHLSGSEDKFSKQTGTQLSHYMLAVVYIILALIVLVRGIIQYAATQNLQPNLTLNGQSFLLGFLAKDGWSLKTIQTIVEPLLLIAIGTAISFSDLVGGLPIIFCAVSDWLFLLFDIFFPYHSMRQKADRLNSDANSNDDFYEIK